MKTIELYHGQLALVDDADYEQLAKRKWHLSSNGYVITTMHFYEDGKRMTRQPSMHRILMEAKPGQEIDHINRDKLDNRRSNLRFCSRVENLLNTKVRVDNRSGYKGVRWKTDKKMWLAEIGYSGKTLFLGHFAEIESAIQARQVAEKRYHSCV